MGHTNNVALPFVIFLGVSLLASARCADIANQQAARGNNGNITPSPLAGSSNGWRPVIPTDDDHTITSRAYNYRPQVEADPQYSISHHPVLTKLHQHMESVEKAKQKRLHDEDHAFSTTPNILGSFSGFGHSTVQNKEPAGSKPDPIKTKKKKQVTDSYQVAETDNEYSMHLVPPPVHPIPPVRFIPDMRKKMLPTYRYPDLHVDEQRHAYYIQPSRPPPYHGGSSTHTTKPPGFFFGGPPLPNFAGISPPHHYPGALAGALFPGPDSIRYFQRPDLQHSSHPQPKPHEGATSYASDTRRPQDNAEQNSDQSYRRPEPTQYKNLLRTEDFVTGRPFHEVRGPETNSFTVGTSFLAGNKPEVTHQTSHTFFGVNKPDVNSQFLGANKPEVPHQNAQFFGASKPDVPHQTSQFFGASKPDVPHQTSQFFGASKPEGPHQTSQFFGASKPEVPHQNAQFFGDSKQEGPHHTQQFFGNHFSTVQPPNFEQAFDTGRPVKESFRPAVTTKVPPGDKHRDNRPLYPGEGSGVHDVQITGPAILRQTSFESVFPPGVVHEDIPTFLPTVTSVQPNFDRPTPPTHLNEVHNKPWSVATDNFKLVDVHTQTPSSIREELTTTRTPSKERPSKIRRPATQTPLFVEESYRDKESRVRVTTERRPTFEEEVTTEYPQQSITEQPETVTEQSERRPSPARKPSRYRQRPATNYQAHDDDGAASQQSRRPSQRLPATDVAAQEYTEPQKEVRQKTRRRRPQTTPETEAVTVQPVLEEEVEEFNHVSYTNDVFENNQQTTTPRPRRKNPYSNHRGQERHRPRITTPEPTPVAEAFEASEASLTVRPEIEEHVNPNHAYAVHEENQEAVVEVDAPSYEELPSTTTPTTTSTSTTTTTTTTTTTPAPAPEPVTVVSTTNRYKPRLRYGSNSTRPRFSVKDYKERLRTTTEPSNDVTTKISVEKEPVQKIRYPSRVRGSHTKQQDENTDDVTDVPVESMRHKYRPKFGAGSSRFRTTSTPAPEDAIKPSTGRTRLPATGKYYSRYRSTTETPIEEKIDLDVTQDATTTPTHRITMKPKNLYSPRRRFLPRGKFGSQNEVATTTEALEETSTDRVVKQASTTSRMEITTNFGTTDRDNEEGKTTLSHLFANLEEVFKPFDNEIAVTKSTKTYVFLPTMPTTHINDFESETETMKAAEATTSVADIADVETKEDDDYVSPSQRVADLTSAATSGGYFNTMVIAKRKPMKYTMATEDPILPIEAFFTNKEYQRGN